MGESLEDVDVSNLVDKSYVPQRHGDAMKHITSGIPPKVLDSAAEREGVTRDELIDNYRVVHYFDRSGRSIIDWEERDG